MLLIKTEFLILQFFKMKLNNSNNDYEIPYKNLKDGFHNFEFILGDAFFEGFELSEIKKGQIAAAIELEKKTDMLVLAFNISGYVEVACDICLEKFKMAVSTSRVLYVKFGQADQEVSEDVLILAYASNAFDCSHYLYEFIHLALPMRRTHEMSMVSGDCCDIEMIKQLEALKERKSSNLHYWEELKKLK